MESVGVAVRDAVVEKENTRGEGVKVGEEGNDREAKWDGDVEGDWPTPVEVGAVGMEVGERGALPRPEGLGKNVWEATEEEEGSRELEEV